MTMESAEHYVIIGNGATANKAAAAIRKGDKKGRITLISNEFFPFYYRHRLCDFMVGKIKEADLAVSPATPYKEKNIRLRLGQGVGKIDFPNKTIYLKHMEKIQFTKLLLATGGKPRLPETYYSYHQHFTFLKTLADAKRLKKILPDIKQVLIVGSDLISLKVAKALHGAGKEIVFMVDQNSFWPLTLSDKQQTELKNTIKAMGIEVLDDTIKGVNQEGDNSFRVTTKQGKLLKTELIGSFFGQVPDIEFLMGSGLDLERGVIVNEFLETNIADVFAAGDCAQVYNPGIKNYWVSIGWHNAKRLGTLAGENMLGNRGSTDLPPKDLFSLEGIKVSTNWWKEL